MLSLIYIASIVFAVLAVIVISNTYIIMRDDGDGWLARASWLISSIGCCCVVGACINDVCRRFTFGAADIAIMAIVELGLVALLIACAINDPRNRRREKIQDWYRKNYYPSIQSYGGE